MNYHAGQWSREYRILSKISYQYKLKLTDSAISSIEDITSLEYDEWFKAREIYAHLVQRYDLYHQGTQCHS